MGGRPGNNRKQPKAAFTPPGKSPRIENPPQNFDIETPAWQFNRCDSDHARWGWNKLSAEDRWAIITTSLAAFERMTWAEIRKQAGGKGEGKGTNHHSLAIEGFCKEARDRLRELRLDDLDELFSLRLANRTRLYGVKEGRVLRFVWHDPFHGEKTGAYPTG